MFCRIGGSNRQAISLATTGPWITILGAVVTDSAVVQRLTNYIWVGLDSVQIPEKEHEWVFQSNRPLPAVPSDAEDDADEQPEDITERVLAITLTAEEEWQGEGRKAEERSAEQEAGKREQEAVNEKLQQILRMLEDASEQGPSSEANHAERESSSDEARC